MSVDQIYRWLLETSTRGRVIEDMMTGETPMDGEVLEAMLDDTGQLADMDPAKRADWREAMLEELDTDL